jgi:hypothetical protein
MYNRWPRLRNEPTCPFCGSYKGPGPIMCLDCFQREKVGTSGIVNKTTRFGPATEQRLTELELGVEDDPWAAALDDFAREFPDW